MTDVFTELEIKEIKRRYATKCKNCDSKDDIQVLSVKKEDSPNFGKPFLVCKAENCRDSKKCFKRIVSDWKVQTKKRNRDASDSDDGKEVKKRKQDGTHEEESSGLIEYLQEEFHKINISLKKINEKMNKDNIGTSKTTDDLFSDDDKNIV